MLTLTYNLQNDIYTYIITCQENQLENYIKLLKENGAYKIMIDNEVIYMLSKKYGMKEPTINNTNTTKHYKSTIKPIDLINAQNLNFNLGNVVKYVCSASKKKGENILTDLEKAKDCINFEIERVKQWTNVKEKN